MNKYVSKYTNMKQKSVRVVTETFFPLDTDNFGSSHTPREKKNAVRCVRDMSIKMRLSRALYWCLLMLVTVTHLFPPRFGHLTSLGT